MTSVLRVTPSRPSRYNVLVNVLQTLRDLAGLFRYARSPVEVARAAIPALQRTHVLNEGCGKTAVAVSESDASLALVGELRRHMLGLQAAALRGGAVDYDALASGAGAALLRDMASALARVRPDAFEGEQRLAFWLNLYNTLSIHGALALNVRRSVMEVPSFFSAVRYRVGGSEVSLDHVEHGILRRNAPHPLTGRRLFPDPADPRLGWGVEQLDPRIHAALVCSSRSCPPVAVYDAGRVDHQLDRAMAGFVAAETRVNPPRRRIETSAIFRYYRADFGGSTGAVVATLCRFAPPDLAMDIRRAWAAGWSLWFRPYDWSLNRVGT